MKALQCLSVDINKLITAGNTSWLVMALTSLRNLTVLQRLAINCPLLQELPVGNRVKWQYLRHFNLFNVKAFPELTGLTSLHIWACPLASCLPAAFGLLTGLQTLS